MAERILQRCPLLQTARKKRVANSSPATHQTLQQQGGTGEDSYINLADWTLNVAAIKKKNNNNKNKNNKMNKKEGSTNKGVT